MHGVAHGFRLLRTMDYGVWEHWIFMVGVELEISSGDILHGSRDASATVGVASCYCGSAVATWFPEGC